MITAVTGRSIRLSTLTKSFPHRKNSVWTASRVREEYLKYFEKNGHKRVKSDGLIPTNDPSLLFTNAGIVLNIADHISM